MPVRKIPKNYLGVTGGFASKKNGQMLGFESLLEKEYMLLLEFDETVESFEEQPVSIPIPGTKNSYTPDLLVRFHPVVQQTVAQRPCLVEVKHTDDLTKNSKKYAPKFELATAYAAVNNWDFRIVTQKDIRIPKLSNLKFLREYRNINPAESDLGQALEALKGLRSPASFNTMIDKLLTDSQDKLYWIPIIWHLIVTKEIHTDLDTPFSDNILIWLPQVSNG
ncbi:TnsA endonuclease N-terminal domain-containing protein [Herbaspirillum sp. RTI4]|uniref:TnsA endonuclease N-terminal domain-containing protein n=1 Tax=Herbaspirillum sp. RTI4 TaxID=3048640 RepID=UPI002AB5649F|nr:TnsA endonuclease N-terminal domain-containing protein [Herbaspirillum sp. RTI4]MDY7577273.1 TnsA endonuclease N-terminal domain-containing protein [Herbaspirillum sp. RTI4]MEA9983537.1 TnsA endonuclease N-terminal domain-containing protein [Herbaspirillum sp. RTI4]